MPSLESLLSHDGRVDLLACMGDGEPLAVPQLSADTGQSARAVRHHLKLLGAFDLVEASGTLGEEPCYTATLDKHPEWVREAVEERRRGHS